jgi:cytochrome c-type biogenesis protein
LPARTLVIAAAAAVVLLATLAFVHGGIGDLLERQVGSWQNAIASRLAPASLSGWRLYAVAFGGGLAASLSPCILGMLPVNLAFIGAAGSTSRRRSALVAGSFSGGVAVVNVTLGLVASLFFAVIVQYRSPVNIAVGAVTVLMGLWMAGIITIPTPQLTRAMPKAAGPFAAGILFALVASPCASPVLIAVLGAATQDGSIVRALVAMMAYTIGYTIVLFAGSLSASVLLTSRRLLRYGETIARVGGAALVLFGIATFAYGISLR